MKIPPSLLSEQALRGIALEFVSREGTDYGHKDWDMETKVTQVLGQIARGDVVILADPDTGSCNLVPRIEGDRILRVQEELERLEQVEREGA